MRFAGKDISSDGYNHFMRGPCPQVDDHVGRDQQRIEKAGQTAKEKVRAENPDLSEEDLQIKFSDAVRERNQARDPFPPYNYQQILAQQQAAQQQAMLLARQQVVIRNRALRVAHEAVPPAPAEMNLPYRRGAPNGPLLDGNERAPAPITNQGFLPAYPYAVAPVDAPPMANNGANMNHPPAPIPHPAEYPFPAAYPFWVGHAPWDLLANQIQMPHRQAHLPQAQDQPQPGVRP